MSPAPEAQIARQFAAVQQRIAAACRRFERDPASVALLAVSKGQPLAALQAAIVVGQRRFGESYLQEALDKLPRVHCPDCEWHFIGPLQSNKTAGVAQRFHWAHSVSREKIARRLNDQRPPDRPPLQICLQVNISGEASKSGVSLAELPALARSVEPMPNLQLRGLMGIPRPTPDFEEQRVSFRRLREAWLDLQDRGFALDTLSMGMSADLEAAIAEGATLVRIGTALFGPRRPVASPGL